MATTTIEDTTRFSDPKDARLAYQDARRHLLQLDYAPEIDRVVLAKIEWIDGHKYSSEIASTTLAGDEGFPERSNS